MVLSNEEFNTAEICDIDKENEQMSSLFQLRQSTHSFLIQCLADREIQKLIYSKPNYSSSKSAYSYNCAVIHRPHAWYHLNAVRGHGWNAKSHQPLDPKLRIGIVHAHQYLIKKQNNDNHLARTQQAKEQIRQYEETIRILKEENTQVKQNFLNALKDRNGNTGNVNTNNTASNSQQLNQLQQETRALKGVIESHKETIQILNDHNISLQWKVNGLQTQSSSENKSNASNSQQLNQLQQETRALKGVIESHKETIQILEDQNSSLQWKVNGLQTQLSSENKINASNSQQLEQFQQETRALKGVIESHKETIQILKDQNSSLQLKVNGLQTQSSSENKINASNNQLIYMLKEEIRMVKLASQQKTEKIRTLESQNLNLQSRLRDAEMNPPSNSLPSRSPRTGDNGSKGCCIIM